jgi:hypothetical protein
MSRRALEQLNKMEDQSLAAQLHAVLNKGLRSAPKQIVDRLTPQQQQYLEDLHNEAALLEIGTVEYARVALKADRFVERLEKAAKIEKPKVVINEPKPVTSQESRETLIHQGGKVEGIDDIYTGWNDVDAPLELKDNGDAGVDAVLALAKQGESRKDEAREAYMALDAKHQHAVALRGGDEVLDLIDSSLQTLEQSG